MTTSRNVNRLTDVDRDAIADAVWRIGETADPDERRAEMSRCAQSAIGRDWRDLRQSERDEVWTMILAADEKWIAR